MNPVSPADIAATEVALTTAETLALNYMRLPLCGTAEASKLCTRASVKQTVKDADNRAYAAVQSLRASSASGAPAALAAAQAAIAALSSAVTAATPTQ